MQKFNTKMWNLVEKMYSSNPHFSSSGTPILERLATIDRPIREVVRVLEFDPWSIRIFEFGITCECFNGVGDLDVNSNQTKQEAQCAYCFRRDAF